MKNGGDFEAESKKKLTEKIIEYFAENNEESTQIKAIYCIFKDDSTDEFCSDVVLRIQNIVDKGVVEAKNLLRRVSCQKEIEREVSANFL